MQVRLSAFVFAVGAVAAIGCGDSTAFRAQFANELLVRNAYAINGTAPSLPSALAVRSGAVVRVDNTFQFDLAFDMDGFGFVTVYSARRVAGELSPVSRVGFAIDSVHPFDQITRAPTTGYAYDTAMTLQVGRTLLIDVFEATCQGQSFLGFNIRAKLMIDSVDATKRQLFFRMIPNRNCGFRSLIEGLPKD
jgi:hypothetical protein